MRIEYKILWVEDEKSWYKTTLELFEGILDDLGFKLISKKCENIDEVKTEIGLNKLKEYDLLLVDYTLKNSDSGDKIIEFIRNIKDDPILTDVLFYSSAIENVRDSMHKLGLEGVYTADRKDIETKFELVLNTTIKKIQEVNSIRGLIMAETSDLDALMLSIIESVFDGDIGDLLKEYSHEKIQETIKDNTERANSTQTSILEKIKDGRIFTSFHKAKVINKICSLKPLEVERFFENYNKYILKTRNNFAHVTESIENGEKVLISHITGKKEIFNEERCIEIRKSLIEYRNVLEKISQGLSK